MRIRRKQAGDTIVEVLISIAVVSVVLAGAFVSANRSLLGNQQSQERGEAVRMAEQQLEQLKVAATVTGASTIFNVTPATFCFDSAGVRQPLAMYIADINTDNFGAYQAGAVNCTGGPGGRYKLAVTRGASDTFTTTVRWDKAGGNGVEEVRIIYRVYP